MSSPHAPAIHRLSGAGDFARSDWYMACPCGWVAPLRRSKDSAAADAAAHLRAAHRKYVETAA